MLGDPELLHASHSLATSNFHERLKSVTIGRSSRSIRQDEHLYGVTSCDVAR
jgi:hypothetical protein